MFTILRQINFWSNPDFLEQETYTNYRESHGIYFENFPEYFEPMESYSTYKSR